MKEIMCNGSSMKLCDNDNCVICYEKSFASHKRSDNWHSTKNGEIIPRNILRRLFILFSPRLVKFIYRFH